MTTEPQWIEIAGSGVTLKALTWGFDQGGPERPIALCLHGFPDTAYGWRKIAPQLVAAGYRVVAPMMRGYAPSGFPVDGSYHVGALMDDALRARDAAGPTDGDLLVGHDWGAIAATGLSAMPDSPFRKAVIMSVPPSASFQPPGRIAHPGRLAAEVPRQLLRSWYIMYFQLPWLPEHSAQWVVPRLWRQWSPGYDATEDVQHVFTAIGAPAHWRAALGPYRATVRNSAPPQRFAGLHQHWLSAPQLPVLYLHGGDDGCATAAYTDWVRPILPVGSRAEIVAGAGHFLQLEQPERVGRLIVDFASAAD
ncbi:alpha/beta fold hydrolase [Mycolicibacterium mengxianglii]|uniref:alpha/beta fold hydrolase n=1 Tax=Mycolicibacterium mengxianglii TaxID=2736649 RepID=UPI0018D18D01|nr:alpha/beta fold hydrolase [Mycolicibacterium mengxianglii]